MSVNQSKAQPRSTNHHAYLCDLNYVVSHVSVIHIYVHKVLALSDRMVSAFGTFYSLAADKLVRGPLAQRRGGGAAVVRWGMLCSLACLLAC